MMSALDTIYRIFMFILPGAICITAYVWVGRKALLVPQKGARIIALAVIAAGLCFTLYRMALSVKGVFANDIFEYLIIIVAVGVLALASIVMAIGQPEEEGNRRTDEQGMTKKEGNGLEQ